MLLNNFKLNESNPITCFKALALGLSSELDHSNNKRWKNRFVRLALAFIPSDYPTLYIGSRGTSIETK